MGAYLGYNKRPKIKDAEGNIIGSGNMTFGFGKKNPVNGNIDFANLPPELYSVSVSKFAPNYSTTVKFSGCNFNEGTIISVEGCTVSRISYYSPNTMFALVEAGADVMNCRIVINNGVEGTFRNMLKIVFGDLFLFTEADFATNGIVYTSEDGYFRKSDPTYLHHGIYFNGKTFEADDDFEVFFRCEPAYLDADNNTEAQFGFLDPAIGPDQYYTNWIYPIKFHRTAGLNSYPANEAIPEGEGGWNHVFSYRRYNGKLTFNVNGVEGDVLDAANAQRLWFGWNPKKILDVFDVQIFDLL